ncbi:hypothetical protein FPV67DRAFT_1667868 [Lyophyllum atratum]|nr:hypothetical protein FPV67DRAFT_1667868 [Lyophyllum atratum]
MSNPPTYQVAMRQLELLKSQPIPLEIRCTAHKAMEKELSKPEITRSCLEEVKQLIDIVIKIDQAFERIKTDLGKIDNSYIICKPVHKFQPSWIALQQRFAVLLWIRAQPQGRQAHMSRFLNVILPGLEDIRSNADYKDAAADLKEFIGRKDPFRTKLHSKQNPSQPQKHSQAFADLLRDITLFKNGIDLFAQEQGVELHEDVIRLHGVIDRLNLEVECCEMMILSIGIALGVTGPAVCAESVASLAALGLLGPAVTRQILFAGATAALPEIKGLIAFVSNTNEYEKGISSTRMQVNDLKTGANILERLQVALKTQEAGITDTCGRIDRLAAIRSYVAHDAKLIASELEVVVRAEGDPSRKAFMARLELTRKTYGTLANVLKEYATQIDGHSFRFAQGDLGYR